MKYLQRKIVLLAASAVFAAVYAALQDYSFALDAAVAASFTILVFGNALRKTGMGLMSGEESKPLAEVMLVHTMCVLSLLAIYRIGMHLAPLLPAMMNQPMMGAGSSHPGPTGFKVVQTLVVAGMGWVELQYLTSKRRPDEGQKRTEKPKIVWGKAALEEERANRLRLR